MPRAQGRVGGNKVHEDTHTDLANIMDTIGLSKMEV